MSKSGNKQKFSSVWLTQTQLGEYCARSAKEIGQYLVDTGLRAYDPAQELYVPTEKARTEGYCKFTPLRNGKPFYMWHRQKTLQLLQEKIGLVLLEEADMKARTMACELIKLEKEAQRGNDKLYYLFFDSIPPKKLPRIMAWALLITYQEHDPIYTGLLESIAANEIQMINNELLRLGSEIRLDDGQPTGQG